MLVAALSPHRPRPLTASGAAAALLSGLVLSCPPVSTSAASAAQTPALAAAPTAPIIEETFVLKHLKPSALVTFLAQVDKLPAPAKPGTGAAASSAPAPPAAPPTPVLLPASIKSVTPDDVFNTVTIQGAPDAIAAIRKVAVLLDVPPQPVRLTVRIIRYRSAAAQKAAGSGSAPLADVEEVAFGTVETSTNTSVELTTYGDRHTFRARLIPHINNAASVSVSADLQMARPDGTFEFFSATPSGTRQLRIGDRGLITSLGSGIGASAAAGATGPAGAETAKSLPRPAPETYYLEVTPSLPAAAIPDKAAASPAKP